MVDDGQGSGRCGRAAHRGAGRHGEHVRERHRRAHGGALDAAAARRRASHRVLGRRFSVDDLPVPRTGGARLSPGDRCRQRRRQRGSRAHRRGHRRSHGAGRRLARAVPIVVHPGPRADCRARQARRARRWCSTCIRRPASSRSTSRRSAWTLPPAGASSGCAVGPATRFSTRGPIDSRAVRPRFTGWASHPQPFAFDIEAYEPPAGPSADADRHAGDPGVLRGVAGTCAAGVDRHRHRARDLARASRAACSTLVDQHGFHTIASRDPARLAGTVAVDVPDARRSPAPSTRTTSSSTTARASGSAWPRTSTTRPRRSRRR